MRLSEGRREGRSKEGEQGEKKERRDRGELEKPMNL